VAGWHLSALLRELRHNLLHDKSDQVGGASDYLWSDATLVGYINEAQRRFARQSLVIHDHNSLVTTFTTVAHQQFYPLDPCIIAVLSVKMKWSAGNLLYDHTTLARAGFDAFSNYHTPDPLFFDANQLERMPPGKPLAWSTDEGVEPDANGSYGGMVVRLFPLVSTDFAGLTYQMRVVREPANDLVLSNLAAYPELPAAHHLDMLDYAAYLALRNVDTDIAGGNAPARAADFEKRFDMNCARAKNLVMRKLFAPQQWGFGHQGWSWEH